MKSNKISSSRTGRMASLALAVVMVGSLTTLLRAAEPVFKGGANQLMRQIKTPAEAEALKPGDSMAMVCTKCKSVMMHNVTTEKGHIKTMTVGEKHLCPGCDSTITVVGTGRGPNAAHDEVKHVCAKCGDDSAFCCATKPGIGSTKGMEKK